MSSDFFAALLTKNIIPYFSFFFHYYQFWAQISFVYESNFVKIKKNFKTIQL